MSSQKKSIGANIRHERMIRNMSIDELAEMLHLSTAFIGLIERGQRGAKLSNLIKIADIFGLTVNDLIYGIEGDENKVQEDTVISPSVSKSATISSLLYNLTEGELDYVIASIRNLKLIRTSSNPVTNEEADNFDEDDESDDEYVMYDDDDAALN